MNALVSCALAVPVGSVCMGTQDSWGKSDQPSLNEQATIVEGLL